LPCPCEFLSHWPKRKGRTVRKGEEKNGKPYRDAGWVDPEFRSLRTLFPSVPGEGIKHLKEHFLTFSK
jgi:hypothetical protein